MAFKKLQKAKTLRGAAAHGPQLTISKSGTIGISAAAWQALGEPAAVHLEWDSDDYLLRVVASSPDDPAAYEVTGKRLKWGAQALLRELGLNYQAGTKRFPMSASGRLALVADVSRMPGGTVTPIRRTA